MESMRRFLRVLEPSEQETEERIDDDLEEGETRTGPAAKRPRPSATSHPNVRPSTSTSTSLGLSNVCLGCSPSTSTSSQSNVGLLGHELSFVPVQAMPSSSLIWNYYQKCSDSKTAKFNTCLKVLKISTGSTTSLHRHLQGKHDFQIQEMLKQVAVKKVAGEQSGTKARPKQGRQETLSNMVVLKQKWQSDHRSAKKIIRYVLKVINKHVGRLLILGLVC
jgi:BED zinc finger